MNELYPAAAAGAILTVVVIYVAISYRIALGVTAAERTELEDSPADYGVDFEDVEFRSRCDDVLLDGWYLAGQDGVACCCIRSWGWRDSNSLRDDANCRGLKQSWIRGFDVRSQGARPVGW